MKKQIDPAVSEYYRVLGKASAEARAKKAAEIVKQMEAVKKHKENVGKKKPKQKLSTV